MDAIIPIPKWPVDEPVGSDWPTSPWLWPSAAGDGIAQPWVSDFPHDSRW